MLLETRRWGRRGPDCVVCLHGLSQDGGVFEPLGEQLAAGGASVLALDLRGHGGSDHEPPWDVGTHVADVAETLAAHGVERATLVGHSFGGRVAATLAAGGAVAVPRLVLLDPGLRVPAELALRAAEVERLDWSFASVEGAVEAVLSSESVVVAPREAVAAHVGANLRRGGDGRFRFRFSPGAVVVAWSEMTLPPPPVAPLPTLVVLAAVPLIDSRAHVARYREALGDLLTVVEVPGGHNVLWESPRETTAAVEAFLADRGPDLTERLATHKEEA